MLPTIQRWKARAQAGTELLIVYGMALLIIVIVSVLIYRLFPSSAATVYNTCTFSGGVTCSEIILGVNTITSNTFIVLLLNNAGSSYIQAPSVIANFRSINTSAFPCMPRYVKAGGSIVCVVNMSIKAPVGQGIAGSLFFNEQNCAFATSGTCQQPANQVYAGSFEATTQAAPQQLGLGITLVAATATPSANNQKDQLNATVTLMGYPLKGVTVNFTANSLLYQVSPKYGATNGSGTALSYVWGSKTGPIKVYANFSNTVSSNVVLTFS